MAPVLVPSISSMSLILLVVLVVLSNNAPASSASFSSSSKPLPAADTSSSSGGDAAASPPPLQEKEKAVAAEREVQKEYLKYAQEKGLVSRTNGTGWYKGIAREFVDAHNEARSRYGVPPVKWDRNLARQARRWSNAMRKDCQMLHSGQDGESVFRSHDDWNATAKDAVLWWSKEENMYDKNTEKCTGGHLFKDCGHFALMVGKRSQKVGCARAECFKGGVFITCNYDATDDLNNNKEDKDKEKPPQN